MSDVHDLVTRSKNMSAIKGSNTKIEIIIRKVIHKKSFRYTLHNKKLPGKPDMVFPKYKAVIFVHGCFWHKHNCSFFKWPKTREKFWREKILGNVKNDKKKQTALSENGWRIGIVWECALRGKNRISTERVADMLSNWLKSDINRIEIQGQVMS